MHKSSTSDDFHYFLALSGNANLTWLSVGCLRVREPYGLKEQKVPQDNDQERVKLDDGDDS